MRTLMAAAISAALAGCAFGAPALGETLGEKTGVNSTLGIAPTTADFVREAAISDMFEIASSKLALERTSGPTKSFAEKMIEDHSKTTSELKTLAQKAKVDVPDQMDDAHKKLLASLEGTTGADFDKTFHSDQDSGHKTAVSLFTRYAKGGSDAELKQWASTTLPHLEDHLKMAEDLDK